jgi:hypothetical protein
MKGDALGGARLSRGENGMETSSNRHVTACLCGCGLLVPKAGRRRDRRYATAACRMRGHRAALRRAQGERAERRRQYHEMIDLGPMSPAERRVQLGLAAHRLGLLTADR